MRLLVALVLAISVPGITAQQQPGPPTALISGRVVDAFTGKPLAGAVVRCAKGSPSPLLTRSDADGRFTFPNLDNGSYTIWSEVADYENGYWGNMNVRDQTFQLPLQRGERAQIVIKMWRSGVVTGTVLEQDGQPAVGLLIQGLRRQSGKWVGFDGRPALTDDRGRYRMPVSPGEYLVMAQANSGASNKALLQTTFAPSATTSASAVPVKVQSGAETAGVDLRVNVADTPRTGRRIAGVVSAPDGSSVAGLEVRLTPVDAGATAMYDQRTVRTDAKGFFEFRGLPESDYTLRVVRFPERSATEATNSFFATAFPFGFMFDRRPSNRPETLDNPLSSVPPGTTMTATLPITVADRDRVNIEVPLEPAARFRGRVVFDGPDGPPATNLLTIAPIVLPADDTSLPSVPQGRLEADGTFQSIGLPAGPYSVALFTNRIPEWTLASVERGGKNVTGQAIDLGAVDVVDVVLTYTSKRTVLAGTVRDSQGRPAPSGRVYVFPQQPALRTRSSRLPLFVQQTQSSPNGPFEFKRMIPGDYLVAYTTEPPEDWSEPGFLESLERVAVPVHINLGETKTVELRTVPAR